METGHLLTLIAVIVSSVLGTGGLLAVSIRQLSKRIDDTNKRIDDNYTFLTGAINNVQDNLTDKIETSHNTLTDKIETSHNTLMDFMKSNYTALSDLIKITSYHTSDKPLIENPTSGLKLENSEHHAEQDESASAQPNKPKTHARQ